MVGISRKVFRIWLTGTILLWVAIGFMLNAGGFIPAHYQVNFPLRADLPPWQKGDWGISAPLRKPLYEIIRSPSAEKLPVEFQWRGYQGAFWNQHINGRRMPQHNLKSGDTLDLPVELTEADRAYILQAFRDQQWSRWWNILKPYAQEGIFLPLGVLFLLWVGRQLLYMMAGKKPAPDAPRLPYSPNMERLRKATLIAGGIGILFWVVAAILNQREDPQPFSSVISVMLPVMLPSIAAFLMSLLYRAPIFAAVLAAFGLYLALPELAALILPASWLSA